MEMTVAEKVRLIMKRKGISMGDLAAATGQTRQNLSNKMSRGNFSEKDIQAMAEAMECTYKISFILPDGTEV